jgi:serine/threonine-protein kinase RsbT
VTVSEEVGSAQVVAISMDQDVVRVRQVVRSCAVAAKLSLVDQTKIVTAASELARNTLVYGGGGTAELAIVAREGRRGVRAVFHDEGPGIADVQQALTDGYTTGGGLGLDTVPGAGTKVTVVKWAR